VVAHFASETDTGGRVVRRSTLDLLDFGIHQPAGTAQPGMVPPGVLRRPMVRPGKAARRMDPR